MPPIHMAEVREVVEDTADSRQHMVSRSLDPSDHVLICRRKLRTSPTARSESLRISFQPLRQYLTASSAGSRSQRGIWRIRRVRRIQPVWSASSAFEEILRVQHLALHSSQPSCHVSFMVRFGFFCRDSSQISTIFLITSITTS